MVKAPPPKADKPAPFQPAKAAGGDDFDMSFLDDSLKDLDNFVMEVENMSKPEEEPEEEEEDDPFAALPPPL